MNNTDIRAATMPMDRGQLLAIAAKLEGLNV